MKELKEFTVERLEQMVSAIKAEWHEYAEVYDNISHREIAALAKIALAAKQAEPVAWLTFHQGCRAPDDCEDYLEAYTYKTDEKSVDGSNAFPVFMSPPLNHNEHPLDMVVPDGWKLVPIEPTESMIISGFESEPNEFFSSNEGWKAYKKMSGCQKAAHRAKLCWDAMLRAAPKPEM